VADPVTLINSLVDALLSGDDARAEAIVPALVAFPSEQVTLALAGRLPRADADARWWIARALAVIAHPQSVILLIELVNDPEPEVRACAALALGELRAFSGAQGGEALAARLADESAHVAEICAAALGRIGAAAVPILLNKLETGNVLERIRAAKALAPLESHDAMPALIHALDDASAVVAHYAQEALARMGVGMILLRP
jgi:HEAT repeat protein